MKNEAINTLLLIVDVQKKLVEMLPNKKTLHQATILAKSAQMLNIPVIVTRQYPKGLGEILIEGLDDRVEYVDKLSFSACNESGFIETPQTSAGDRQGHGSIIKRIRSYEKTQIVLCGIETHICVMQTALDLKEQGFDVIIAEDACGSKNQHQHDIALKRLRRSDITVTTVEMTAYEWIKTAQHPCFKDIQALMK